MTGETLLSGRRSYTFKAGERYLLSKSIAYKGKLVWDTGFNHLVMDFDKAPEYNIEIAAVQMIPFSLDEV